MDERTDDMGLFAKVKKPNVVLLEHKFHVECFEGSAYREGVLGRGKPRQLLGDRKVPDVVEGHEVRLRLRAGRAVNIDETNI